MSTDEDPQAPARQDGSQPPADSRPADQIVPEAGLETSTTADPLPIHEISVPDFPNEELVEPLMALLRRLEVIP